MKLFRKRTITVKKAIVGKAKKASEAIKKLRRLALYDTTGNRVRQIYEAFGKQDGTKLEIWEDAGVLEIGIRWSFCTY